LCEVYESEITGRRPGLLAPSDQALRAALLNGITDNGTRLGLGFRIPLSVIFHITLLSSKIIFLIALFQYLKKHIIDTITKRCMLPISLLNLRYRGSSTEQLEKIIDKRIQSGLADGTVSQVTNAAASSEFLA
jgi:hypothetical protein